jgi:hypothetical protein
MHILTEAFRVQKGVRQRLTGLKSYMPRRADVCTFTAWFDRLQINGIMKRDLFLQCAAVVLLRRDEPAWQADDEQTN